MRLPSSTCALLAVLLAACSGRNDAAAGQPPDAPAGGAAPAVAADTAAVGHVIDSTYDTLVQAIRRGDPAGVDAAVHAVYAPDAVVLWNHQAAWHGPNAFLNGARAMLARARLTYQDTKNSRTDLALGGNLAVDNGTYDNTLAAKGGRPVHERGNYLVVWRRQPDGAWRIVREMSNDGPPTTP